MALAGICAGWLWAGCAAGQQRAATQADVGTTVFESHCAGCHVYAIGGNGQNPPLEGSSWVGGPQQRLIKIVLHGVQGPIEVDDRTYDLSMPRFGHVLTDAQIAALASYVRRRFAGVETPVNSDAVRAVRAAEADRTAPWTADELLSDP
jgi:mono/diheme cytochrome c family protein